MLPLTGIFLIVSAVMAAQLAVFASLTFTALLLALYRKSAGHGLSHRAASAEVITGGVALGWMLTAVLVLSAGATLMLSHRLLMSATLDERLEITAHRAGAKHAPENTVAALRQAILDRADWAEVDVQLTKDEALVILHDIDLARIGGGNRGVETVRLDEIRLLDVGKPVAEKFAGERVPTLDEILTAAGRDIRLNVELKPHGKSDETGLTDRVVAAIQQAGLVDRCRICSQSYASLKRVRQLEPALPIGFIAATSVGDLAALDVNFLMVKADHITRSLVDRAAAHRIQIHAWTVNDAALLAPLLDCGIANVITDDPALMRVRLEEICNLTPIERLLLRTRSALTGIRFR